MLKNNFGLKKLGFGGARPSTATRLASAIQDPSATNGLVSGGNWATGITSGVKGFLTGLGAMRDMQNERAYEQDMEKKYQDQLATEAAEKEQAQANWQATFDQNKANADRNYNLSLLTAGFDPERMGDQAYVQEVLDKKRNQAKGEFGYLLQTIQSPEFATYPKEVQQLIKDRANTMAKGLNTLYSQSYFNALGAGQGKAATAQEIAREEAIGRNLLTINQTTGELTPVKGSPEDIKRTEKKQEAEAAMQRIRERSKIMIGNVNKAIELINSFGGNTGITGDLLKYIPQTDAAQLRAYIDTIVNNIGLDELIAVKKAGGSFGALSEKELEGLQSALGVLKQGGNKEVLLQNLQNVLYHYQNLLNDTYPQANAEQVPQGNVAKKPQIPDYNNTNDVDLVRGAL